MASPVLRGLDLRMDRDGPGHLRGGAPRPQPDLERVPLLHPVRQRRRLPGRGGAPTAPTSSIATSSPRRRELVEAVTDRLDDYDLASRVRGGHRLPRRPEQLVHPPQPAPVLGAGRAGGQRGQAPGVRHAVHGAAPRSRGLAPRCCRSWPRRSTRRSPARSRCTSCDWPDPADLPADPELVRSMDRVARRRQRGGHAARGARAAHPPARCGRSPWPGRGTAELDAARGRCSPTRSTSRRSS